MAKVKVLVAFSSGHAGSREIAEEFDYDVDKDPAGLIAEGKVAPVTGSGSGAGKDAAPVKGGESK